MAQLIERAWGSKPFNHYGLTEDPHAAADCTVHAGLHLFEDTAMIEVVDDEYRPVPGGRMGTRYLLTNLCNPVQPLIRYEVTDMLCKATTPCACGRPFALVEALGGRSEDQLYLPRADGHTGRIAVTPMIISLAVEAFLGVREYIADHDTESIRLRLVVPNAEDRQWIGAALPERPRADTAGQGALAPGLRSSSSTTLSAVPNAWARSALSPGDVLRLHRHLHGQRRRDERGLDIAGFAARSSAARCASGGRFHWRRYGYGVGLRDTGNEGSWPGAGSEEMSRNYTRNGNRHPRAEWTFLD